MHVKVRDNPPFFFCKQPESATVVDCSKCLDVLQHYVGSYLSRTITGLTAALDPQTPADTNGCPTLARAHAYARMQAHFG